MAKRRRPWDDCDEPPSKKLKVMENITLPYDVVFVCCRFTNSWVVMNALSLTCKHFFERVGPTRVRNSIWWYKIHGCSRSGHDTIKITLPKLNLSKLIKKNMQPTINKFVRMAGFKIADYLYKYVDNNIAVYVEKVNYDRCVNVEIRYRRRHVFIKINRSGYMDAPHRNDWLGYAHNYDKIDYEKIVMICEEKIASLKRKFKAYR